MTKTALVTGGGHGLGQEISLGLARAGHRVMINYRSHAEEALALQKKIELEGGQARCFQADISSADQVKAMVSQIEDEFSQVDILVNNAGINRDNLLLRTKEIEFREILDTNLLGTFHTCQAVARKMMRTRWGRIINISSVVGLTGNVGQLAYGASKAAVLGMTKTMAREFASRQVTVNAIAPGFIESSMTKALDEKIRDSICQATPLQRFGQAQEVAGLVVYLSGEASGYITGQTIVIDGGLSL